MLLPETDPKSVLDIRGDAEWDLCQQALNEDNSGDWSDPDEHNSHHGIYHKNIKQRKVGFAKGHVKAEVYIPKVEEATEMSMYIQAIGIDINTPKTEVNGLKKFTGVGSKSKFNFDTFNGSNEMRELVGQLHDSRLRGGYSNMETFDAQKYDDSYLTYDASSDDESFIEELLDEISSTSSKKTAKGNEERNTHSLKLASTKTDSDHKSSLRRFVNNRILELMFARLEKELELVKSFSRVQHDTSRSYSYIQTVAQASQHLVKWSKQYCESANLSYISQIVELEEKLQSNLTEQALKAKQESKEDYTPYADLISGEVGSHEARFSMSYSYEDLAYIKVEDLQKFVTEDHAMHILSMVLDEYLKPSHKAVGDAAAKKAVMKTVSEKDLNISYDITPALKQRICREMYFHWVYKRSEYKQSFLRAYHKYMMHLWHQPDKVTVPITEDYDASSLLSSYKQLQRIRKDLDRARLIVDRVRRREKLKKDMIRCSSEQMDIDYFGITKSAIPHSASTSSLGSLSQNPILLSSRKRGRPKLESPYSASKDDNTTMSQGRDRFGKFLRKGAGGTHSITPSGGNLSGSTHTKTTRATSNSNKNELWQSLDKNRTVPDEEVIFSIAQDDSGLESDNSDASFSVTSSSTVAQQLTMTTPKVSLKNDSRSLEDPPSTETNIDKADVKQINKVLNERNDDEDKPSKHVVVPSKTRAGCKSNNRTAESVLPQGKLDQKTPIKSKYMLTEEELLKSQEALATFENLPPSGSRRRVVPGEVLADSLKTPKSSSADVVGKASSSKITKNMEGSQRRSSRTSVPECSLLSIACIPSHSSGSMHSGRKR